LEEKSGGDPFGNNGRGGVFADVDHLGAGVGLHPSIGESDGVKFPYRTIPLQDAGGVLPGDRGAHFHLRP